ncbi:MAG: hypothetical protein LBT79_07345 [Elusimicrobiota bacterium]|jgi:hypothetical protein|nr:hypothetical protein [Elusimicrobiota bacterium]
MTQLSEEDIKTEIANLYFLKSRYTIEKNRLDFAVLEKGGNNSYIYWAESKKGIYDKWIMLAQLILTIKPRLDEGEIPPPFIGCFDEQQITFVEFRHAQEIFLTNDFNWKEKPSAVSLKTSAKVKKFLNGKEHTFNWRDEKDVIKAFIIENFYPLNCGVALVQITKNNFVQIFNKWEKEVLPSIAIAQEFYKSGIISGDFFLADLLSIENKTINNKLKVLLHYDEYKISENVHNYLFNTVNFKDKGEAHKNFWSYYTRPPKDEYQEYIRTRRDLLVPSGIRERKGAFFTPQIWVEKSQEYLAKVFGEDWQDEYYIWDCCAGTGNLEEGLVNKENIWVSTLDDSDVRVMKDNKRLFQNHIFKFDFLNDSFDDLPKGLKDIIDDPKKQEKLIVYINPPYAEAATHGNKANKGGVARTTENTYADLIGKASNEIFTQFMTRIYAEIPLGKLAQFSKLKYVNASNFIKFREFFKAKFKLGFVVHANTFDNVKGQFPIGFLIWDMSDKRKIESVKCDVIENDGRKTGAKGFYADCGSKIINDWYKQFYDESGEELGVLHNIGNDFQQNSGVFISSENNNNHTSIITKNNILYALIYLAVRYCMVADWLNDRDQFLYPNDDWKNDMEFQNDCLAFTLFHSQNRIMSVNGINHWIAFKPSEVGARDDFASSFMSDFIKGRKFSAKAQAVIDAGRSIWKYYQKDIYNDDSQNINASLYEIREYYRGRTDKGRLCPKSSDEKFQALDDAIKDALDILADKIAGGVYRYGFLRK